MARTAGSAADDTRRRILDAAVDLFIERGYAGTSVRDISERLGMTKGSLYYHFASKEDLLLALVEPLMTELDEFVSVAERAGKPADREMIARLVTILDRHGILLRSLMSDPSVLRGIAIEHSMPQRLWALQQALTGGADEAAAIRGRCAIALINAGTIAPHFGAWRPEQSTERERALRRRLSEADKRYVIEAALAVLRLHAD